MFRNWVQKRSSLSLVKKVEVGQSLSSVEEKEEEGWCLGIEEEHEEGQDLGIKEENGGPGFRDAARSKPKLVHCS